MNEQLKKDIKKGLKIGLPAGIAAGVITSMQNILNPDMVKNLEFIIDQVKIVGIGTGVGTAAGVGAGTVYYSFGELLKFVQKMGDKYLEKLKKYDNTKY